MIYSNLKDYFLSKKNHYIFLFKLKLSRFGFYDYKLLKEKLDPLWNLRIEEVLLCPDNEFIDRVPNAGTLKNGIQIMHNGVKICAGGYYGAGIAQMLIKNKGVHEPQEELAFSQVLESLPINSIMIELGAYWSFYSLWFKKVCYQGKNYMIEPEKKNIEYGKQNFIINNQKGFFLNAYVSDKTEVINNNQYICVDDFIENYNIDYLHILHADIQGYELNMLKGAKRAIKNNKIAYIFISTHGSEIHKLCEAFLKKYNYKILCEANPIESFSYDGLIVAKSKDFIGVEKINISKNKLKLYDKVF